MIYFRNQVFQFASGVVITTETTEFDVPSDAQGPESRPSFTEVTITGTPVGEIVDAQIAVMYPHLTLQPGARFYGISGFVGDEPLGVHCLSGDYFEYPNAQVWKQPDLILSAVNTMFGEITFKAGLENCASPEDADSIIDLSATTAEVYPTAVDWDSILTDSPVCTWGAAPFDSFETQDGVRIAINYPFEAISVDSAGPIDYTLQSRSVVATLRPVGTNLDLDAIYARTHIVGKRGARRTGYEFIAQSDSYYVSMTDAFARNPIGRFGVNEINNGTIEIVAQQTSTEGVANPLIYIGTEAPGS